MTPATQMKSWVIFHLLPADILALCAIQADDEKQLAVTLLPPDARVQGSMFRAEHNLFSVVLESELFEPVPSVFSDNRWDGDWPQVYCHVDSALSETVPDSEDNQNAPAPKAFDGAQYAPAPDLILELFEIYEKTGKLEFRLRGLSFEATDLVSLLRGDTEFGWARPFSYPDDARVLGSAQLGENRWILWCSHPSFEICPLVVENNEVLLEIAGDGQPNQFRINLPGLTAQPE